MITVIQHATGPSIPFLELSQKRHRAYCDRKGYMYLVSTADLGNVSPYWNKISLLIAWLKQAKEGDLGVWVDADAWIHDTDTDMSELEIGDMAARCTPTKAGIWINIGFFSVKSSAEMKTWIDEFWIYSDKSCHAEPQLLKYYNLNPTPILYQLSTRWHNWGPIVYQNKDFDKACSQLDKMDAKIKGVHCTEKTQALKLMKYAFSTY